MSLKKDKMLPESSKKNSNLPAPENSTDVFFSSIYSDLAPGESTDIQLKRNLDDTATIRCPEQGKTIVKRPSGNDVAYSYKPKKK